MKATARVSIALPTGALMPGALRLLAKAGLARLSAEELGRQLLVDRSSVRVILVRPADVPAYVDHGAADLGIVGKDILWETAGAHYELLDLRFGGCKLVLAVPVASKLDGPETWPPQLRVATKYPRTAEAWFAARGQAVPEVRLPSAPLDDLQQSFVQRSIGVRGVAACVVGKPPGLEIDLDILTGMDGRGNTRAFGQDQDTGIDAVAQATARNRLDGY